MKNESTFAESALSNFEKLTNKPELFLSIQDNLGDEIRPLLKNCYDFTKTEEAANKRTNALPELIVENFDLEQIWQQLELQNEEFLTTCLTNVSRHIVNKHQLLFAEINTNFDVEDKLDKEDHGDDRNDDDNESDKLDNSNDESYDNEDNLDDLPLSGDDLSSDGKDEKPKQVKRKPKPSIVDDHFFKLNEMEDFLVTEEKKLNAEDKDRDSGNDTESDEEGSVDLFEAESNDDADDNENARLKNPKYKDFFGDAENESKKTRNKFLEEQDELEVEQQKSTLELREERIRRKIENIEESALEEKSWQLKGEITAESRPQNSLLQEIVEFDLTSRPAPVITEQTTFQLEDIIRQRIKDRSFDSVERKKKPVDTPLEYKKKLVLNQEKSKESLAQIYEKEFLKQQEALDPDAADKEEEEPELHKEIKAMMHSLFTKLDALSNFHFTPRPAAPELKIISNLPAISMEEVAPVAASDAALLAPEEVKSKTKGDIIGKTERTETDKNRERRKKKLKQRQHAKEKKKREQLVDKMRPGFGNKYSKEKAKKLLEKVTKDKNVDRMDESYGSKGIKSSTAFFTQLEENVKSHIKDNTKRKKSEKQTTLNAKKMKL